MLQNPKKSNQICPMVLRQKAYVHPLIELESQCFHKSKEENTSTMCSFLCLKKRRPVSINKLSWVPF